MLKIRRLRCSFCRKDETEISKLVAGARAYICDECVAAASRIMNGGGDDPSREARASGPSGLFERARRLLRGGDARRVASHVVTG